MDQFVGQLLLVPYTFAPKGWAFCQGQLLPIAQNTALYSLLGTYFGGDGRSTFGLPNLQGNIPIGVGTDSFGNQYGQGYTGGTQTVTLTLQQMPAHTHAQVGSAQPGTSNSPASASFGQSVGRGSSIPYYVAPGSFTQMAACVGQAGQGQPHTNVMPYLSLNYIIALIGIYPSRQ